MTTNRPNGRNAAIFAVLTDAGQPLAMAELLDALFARTGHERTKRAEELARNSITVLKSKGLIRGTGTSKNLRYELPTAHRPAAPPVDTQPVTQIARTSLHPGNYRRQQRIAPGIAVSPAPTNYIACTTTGPMAKQGSR